MLKVGIIGLPNIGKSTLFNTLIGKKQALTKNYPFCTINPNIGIVNIPDYRLYHLSKIVNTKTLIPACIEFIDIAGLVKGAHKGEGLGNQFLSNIKNVDMILHVVQCFNKKNEYSIINDIDIINTELILSDIQWLEKKLSHKSMKNSLIKKEETIFIEKLINYLNKGLNICNFICEIEERCLINSYNLLTNKPKIYIFNIDESDFLQKKYHQRINNIQNHFKKLNTNLISKSISLSIKLEEDLSLLNKKDNKDFLFNFEINDNGISSVIKESYNLLNLSTFFSISKKEVKAWSFLNGSTASECAKIIHTDFEKGLIKAEIINFRQLKIFNNIQLIKDFGLYKIEGRDYIFNDGDIALFKINT